MIRVVIVSVLIIAFLLLIIKILQYKKEEENICSHYNVDKTNMCNLLPHEEPCIGYENCRKISYFTVIKKH